MLTESNGYTKCFSELFFLSHTCKLPLLLSIFWDPPREAFVIPVIDLPIYWYSLFFACGFLLAYFLVAHLIFQFSTQHCCTSSLEINQIKSLKKESYAFADRLAWYLFIGMLIGARLGHVFFYDWDYFSQHLFEILMTRKGGLASHGAAIGIFIALTLFWKFNAKKISRLSWQKVLDFLAMGASLCGGFIRIGNFFNQEILGTQSDLPWAVVFGHPQDIQTLTSCHPVQLYEASFYFLIFGILYAFSRTCGKNVKDGFICGLFLTSVFTFRFFVEWLKLPQEAVPMDFLQMGQLLSLPFVGFGIYLLVRASCKTRS